MKRIALALIAAGLSWLLLPALLPSAFPQEKGDSPLSAAGTSEAKLAAFLKTLQKAVAADNRAAVAKLVRFPLVASGGKHVIYAENLQQFVKLYSQVFSPGLKHMIADATPEKVFANWKGVMLGDDQNEIWLRAINDKLQITSIGGNISPEEKKESLLKAAFMVHPQVFSMIACWVSDTETPVVTEINLDAVSRNGNQFFEEGLKQEGDCCVFSEGADKGFKSYRVLEAKGNHYTVGYQENSGGTYTSSCIIKFSVEKRQILKDGKPAAIRVLRVLSYASQ